MAAAEAANSALAPVRRFCEAAHVQRDAAASLSTIAGLVAAQSDAQFGGARSSLNEIITIIIIGT